MKRGLKHMTVARCSRALGLAASTAAVWLAGSSPAKACGEVALCVNWTDLMLQDAIAGDHLVEADLDSVPARGARVTVIRPYPEAALDMWLDESGCTTYESQFPSGHKVVVHAEAVIGFGTDQRIHVKMHENVLDLDAYTDNDDPSDDPVAPIWQVQVPALPQDPEPWSVQVDIPNDETQLVSLLATATEVLHRLHYDLDGTLITGTRLMRIALDPYQANAYAGVDRLVLGTAALNRKFIVAHELGHWIQLNVASSGGWAYDYNYGPDTDDPPLDLYNPPGPVEELGNPYDLPCRFSVANLDPDDDGFANPNRHGIRGAEYSGGAMPEGFGHFVAAAAFNDPEASGVFRYYKDIDEMLLMDYSAFEANDGDVALEGGAAAGTLGGRSQWTEQMCQNDWDYPLQSLTLDQEVTTEIDWLRFFWQFSTPAGNGVPTFWETVRLVTYSQDFGGGWTATRVWPHMRDAIDEAGSGIAGYTARFEDVTVDNGVYNEPP